MQRSSDLSTDSESVDIDSANSLLNGTLAPSEELFHDPVPSDVVRRTLQLAKKLGCVTNYYREHEIHAHCRTDAHHELTNRYATLTNSHELYRRDAEDEYATAMALGPPSKLLVLCETENIDDVTSALRKEFCGGDDGSDTAHVIRGSPPFFVEVLRAGVCKGRGLERLCDEIGVPIEECIAMGDGDNDVEFVEAAGRGVAMKNARVTLKERADEVLEWTNDEDGVIKALQRFEEAGLLHLPYPDEEVSEES